LRQEKDAGEKVPKRDGRVRIGSTTVSNDQSERTTDEGAGATRKSTALVPLVQAAQWSHASQQPARPNSIFVTQLMATAEPGPETRPLRATAYDAFTAYRATQHWVAGAGIRPRQRV
jgi:hypothetical protein